MRMWKSATKIMRALTLHLRGGGGRAAVGAGLTAS